MIIYNGKEIASPLYTHGRIIEINSGKSLELALEDLENGTFSTDNYFVSARQIVHPDGSTPQFTPLVPGIPETEIVTGSYKTVLTPAQLTSAQDASNLESRDVAFVEYEKANFNQKTEWKFNEISITNDELKDELLAAAGVLPTLLHEDMSFEELKNKSDIGSQLFRIFNNSKDHEIGSISKDNPVPTAQLIQIFDEFNIYEKRAITRGTVHPRKAFDIARAYKDASNGGFISEEMIDKIELAGIRGQQITRDAFVNEFTSFGTKYAPTVAVYEAAFTDGNHTIKDGKTVRQAPRVLAQYVEGMLAIRGIDPSSAKATSPEVVNEIVGAFDLKSVSKIAKYKSPVLLALSDKVNFGEIKESTITALASIMRVSDLHTAKTKGFPTWFANHKNLTPSEISEMFNWTIDINNRENPPVVTYKKKLDTIEMFDNSLSAAEIIEASKNQKGNEDRKKYERKYNYSFANNEIAIKGRNVVAKQGNLTMRMLSATELKNFTIGYDTHCCQHWGNAGESCVWKYTTDPFAAAVVIERGDRVVAQGFVFTDEALSTLVFDNVEFDNDRDVSTFNDLFAAWSEAMPYENIHVGTGYNQGMNGWGKPVKYNAAMPTTLANNRIYSDYHPNARSIKTNGKVELKMKQQVKIEVKPDEPTRWDELAKKDLAFMLNDCSKTPDERLRIAREFRDNPTNELQMNIIRNYPAAIASIEHPCEEAQMYILNTHPEMITQIKNPCAAIQVRILQDDPSFIKQMDNPSHELKMGVLEKNGMLLEHFVETATDEEINTALAQNGYAVQFLPQERRTESLLKIAAHTTPKSVSLMPGASDAVIKAALDADPMIYPLVEYKSEDTQVYAVMKKPSLINMFPNPCPAAVRAAVERNGLLVRNFQFQYPELREVALRQNGFAIGCLKNPTPDEVRIAIMQNPAAAMAINNESVKAEVLTDIRTQEADVLEL